MQLTELQRMKEDPAGEHDTELDGLVTRKATKIKGQPLQLVTRLPVQAIANVLLFVAQHNSKVRLVSQIDQSKPGIQDLLGAHCGRRLLL